MAIIIDEKILGNTLLQWLLALAIFAVTVAILWLTRRLLGRYLAAFAARTETIWDDILSSCVSNTKLLFFIAAGLFAASMFIELPEHVNSLITKLFIVAFLLQAGIWGVILINLWLESYRRRAAEKSPEALTTLGVVGFVGKIILWSVVLLLVLDNLGVDITALVAGLGIGGIAIALAIQNILGDLFASLSIILDKPFVVGDFIVIDDYLGSVEHVGLKTTRLRSLSGEQLVFSNSDLLNSRIRNYGRMFQRRVVFTIGVTYETQRDKLVRIPKIIREAIEAEEQTRFDRSHFVKYGDSALLYETVYYVLSSDYNTYMDIQQAINLKIFEAFERERIEFAYPTQKLLLTRSESNA